MGTFPVEIMPDVPWRHLRRSQDAHFGAPRSNGLPVHGACDLIVPAGTAVLAVEDGELVRGPYEFLHLHSSGCDSTTYAIEVKHKNFIARYCEIAYSRPPGFDGKNIKEGDIIGFVGTQCGHAMLHFEMFRDTKRFNDGLTDKSENTKYLYVPQANYKRRNDLLDPTPYLDDWFQDLKAKSGRRMDLSYEMDDA